MGLQKDRIMFVTYLYQEQEQAQYRREGPGQFNEPLHLVMRTFGYQGGHVKFTDCVDVRQQVRADHKREYVYGDEDGRADGEHDEQPLGNIRRFVDLQLHHRHLQETGLVFLRTFPRCPKRLLRTHHCKSREQL